MMQQEPESCDTLFDKLRDNNNYRQQADKYRMQDLR